MPDGERPGSDGETEQDADSSQDLEWQDLCSGGAEIVFYHARGGGGSPAPGAEAIIEVGFYLIVAGDCRYWLYADPNGIVTSNVLTAEQATTLAASFRLSQFANLSGDYTWSACDGPQELYWYRSARIRVTPTCGPDTEAESEVSVALRLAWQRAATDLAKSGLPATDGVRYSLFEEPSDVAVEDDRRYRDAPVWPLAGDPVDLTSRFLSGGEYVFGGIHTAAGIDANELRSLRTQLLDGVIGFQGFIPIEQSGGARYQLYVRDTIELEDTDGTLPFEW